MTDYCKINILKIHSMKTRVQTIVKNIRKPGRTRRNEPTKLGSSQMLSPQQFGKTPLAKKVEQPKVRNGGGYRFPPRVPTKEELELIAAKAEMIHAKAVKTALG